VHRRYWLAAAVALLAATTAVVPLAPASAERVAADGWTGTWTASPWSTRGQGKSFEDQTLRQIVHLADRVSGPAVDPSTDRSVTFGGKSDVTIPAGGKAISDETAYVVAPLGDVAVSFHVPGRIVDPTQHWDSFQTNYVAGGNVAGAATLTGFTTNGSYTLLAGLDVRNDVAAGAVVTLGASITDGYISAFDGNRRWPNDLAVRLAATGRVVGVLNQGVSGNAMLDDGPGLSAVRRFTRDVLDQPGVAWAVVADAPINDLLGFSPPTSARLTAGLTEMISAAHARGVRLLCATLTPFRGHERWTPTVEDARQEYNAFVRGPGSGCDAVLDFATATQDPDSPDRFRPAFDSGDHLHPNTAGLQAMADAVDLNIFGAPTGPVITPTTVIGLRSRQNSKIVTAEAGGQQPLIANRDAVGPWEAFDRIPQADGTYALRAHANGKFVTASTTQPLIADATTVGTEQRFRFVANADGSVSMQSVAGSRYVSAEDGGAQPLIANRESIGPWELFDLLPQ
jgi:lysophospholipase L1-like esterase